MTGTPLFDPEFYQAQADGLPNVAGDLLLHYRGVGWRLLLDPHPLFSTAHYLRHAGELKGDDGGSLDPLQHYARYGVAAGLPTTRWFDAAAYLRGNPDVAAAGIDPLTHYAGHGAMEQRSAGAYMDAFLRQHPAYQRPGGGLDAARDDRTSYDAWCRTARHVPPAAQAAARAMVPGRPVISVLLHASDAVGLQGALDSLRAQVHAGWELCATAAPDAVRALKVLVGKDRRVRVLPLPEGGVDDGLNVALAAARGGWAWMMKGTDRLHPLAFATLATASPGCDAVYADEDWMPSDGDLPRAPVFRPAWSPELLLADEALARACLVRTGRLREVGGFRAGCGGATVFDLVLRALLPLPPGQVAQVPHALVHRTGPQPDRQADAAGVVSRVLPGAAVTLGRTGPAVVFAPVGEPCVGVVITGSNATVPGPLGPDWLLGACLAGLRGGTDWPALDIAVAVAGPLAPWQEQVIAAMGARHAPGIDAAARAVRGDAVLLLHEAVTPRGPGWLRAMLGALQRPGVGVVGARLSFPDGRLCHAGLTVQEGAPVRPFFASPGDGADAMPHTLRTCLAVSGDCMLVSRGAWKAAGGLGEAWPGSLAEVDLCLRVAAQGLRTVYVPEAALFHARPVPLAVPLADAERFREMWAARTDPFYPGALPSWTPLGAVPLDAALGTPFEARPLPPGAVPGITWFGPVNRASGLGTASRGYLAACAAAGLGVRVVPLDREFAHQPMVEGPPPGPMQDFPVTVLHVNADTLTNRSALHPEAFLNARARVGLWVWEMAEARPEWAAAARRMHEIWVPSAFCAKAFRAITDVPVAVVPHVVPRRDRPGRATTRAALHTAYGVPPGAFMALYMLDTHSYVARKNPQALLDAFAAEFGTPVGTPAVLVLKVSAPLHLQGSPWPEDQALLHVVRSPPPNVVVITDTLDDAALVQLLGGADCYVSPHRSEGFGLTVAEAMALGTPVVTTDWGATSEFVTFGTGLPIECAMVPLDADRGPYRAGSLWADASVPHLRTLLRQVANDRTMREAVGAAGQSLVRHRFSAAAVGAVIRQRVEGLLART